jgi:hypothetical protein
MEKSVTFTGACANEIIPSINRSFVYKAKEGCHVRISNNLNCVTLILITVKPVLCDYSEWQWPYNIMWLSLSVTCDRSVVFSGSSGSSTNTVFSNHLSYVTLFQWFFVRFGFMVLNVTFNNISVISWIVLLVEKNAFKWRTQRKQPTCRMESLETQCGHKEREWTQVLAKDK